MSSPTGTARLGPARSPTPATTGGSLQDWTFGVVNTYGQDIVDFHVTLVGYVGLGGPLASLAMAPSRAY